MLSGIRVLDRTTEIAGPYCTKVLADAGADVLRSGPPESDPICTYRSGALFEYLNASKRSLTGTVEEAVADADLVVTYSRDEARDLHETRPSLVVVCISPFGMDGPWAERPATELTLQAACGSTGGRGDPDLPPVPAGGRLGEWVTGTYAAVAAVAAVGVEAAAPLGRLVDVAMLDCMALALTTFPSVFASFAGWPPIEGTGRNVEIPSVEPTEDGFCVFTTNSAQQFQDFVVMIGRPDWQDDKKLARAMERFARRREFTEAVRLYTEVRTTDAVLEEAGLFRIPAAPVLDGSTVAEFEQFQARHVFERCASGRFRQPRAPYRIGGISTEAAIDSHQRGDLPREKTVQGTARKRPLAGVRVLDCTAWWAGPSATEVLACLGADVVKVESHKRPDPMRMASTRSPKDPEWMEWSPIFHSVNSSKRGVTLDLSSSEGVAIFERLVANADLMVENYTPRVMEQFGLGWERVHALNQRLVMVRMPAFGLDGPWRDRTGFAQTMESISGMAWVTGFTDGPPTLVRGACDPVAGMHAVVAALLALRARNADGQGRLVECAMVESALNITAEQIIEWDVSGALLGRDGSRRWGTVQGVYRCEGTDRWVAISAESDSQWHSLRTVVGIEDEPRWSTGEGRYTDADEIDQLIEGWTSSLRSPDVVALLVEAGVPASEVVRGPDIVHNPQLRHRGFFEKEDHPVTGTHDLPTMPFRFSDVEAWMSSPAPTLGQHTHSILSEVASPEELEQLSDAEPL